MKCKNCRGTGERHTINWETGKVYIVQGEKCPVCGGKGDIEQTNEEWFDGLSTEEKAKFFHGIVIRAMQATWDGKKPDYPAYLSDWKKWLKEKHDAE